MKGKLKSVIVYAENPDKTMNPKFFDSDLYATLQYAENSNKTDQELFVSGINCSKHNAYAQMVAVKKKFGERGTVVAYHGYQSFKENEVTPEECHEIGIETARKMWGDKYQVIVTTHLDKQHHLHNHFCQGVNVYFFISMVLLNYYILMQIQPPRLSPQQ